MLVKKEEKVYFMDWAYCKTDEIIFENFLALQLYRACHIWTEQGWGKAKKNQPIYRQKLKVQRQQNAALFFSNQA